MYSIHHYDTTLVCFNIAITERVNLSLWYSGLKVTDRITEVKGIHGGWVADGGTLHTEIIFPIQAPTPSIRNYK
jgi:hypothetical protein